LYGSYRDDGGVQLRVIDGGVQLRVIDGGVQLRVIDGGVQLRVIDVPCVGSVTECQALDKNETKCISSK